MGTTNILPPGVERGKSRTIRFFGNSEFLILPMVFDEQDLMVEWVLRWLDLSIEIWIGD